jgi:hypothetical protein
LPTPFTQEQKTPIIQFCARRSRRPQSQKNKNNHQPAADHIGDITDMVTRLNIFVFKYLQLFNQLQLSHMLKKNIYYPVLCTAFTPLLTLTPRTNNHDN